jgi:hypothetical protein
MVPDFHRADPRYHTYEKCGVTFTATVDGKPAGYTNGVFEGPEGWALVASRDRDPSQVHACPNCTTYHDIEISEGETYPVIDRLSTCVEPAFGVVAVDHTREVAAEGVV